jgi:PHD/YefM family antitoxin component YafN of YafNO toxin-antitoxin module
MRVSMTDLVRNFSLLSDKALNEPVIIAKNGRDRLVLVNVEEYLMMRETIGSATTSGASVLDTADKGEG